MEDNSFNMNMPVPNVSNKQIPGAIYVVNRHKLLTVQYGVI